MKVSDYIIQFLASKKIDKVFSYIGKNAHLCDSIDKHPDIENVFNIHEQGTGFAADAYARITGKTGVATVTSGPGATNLVTAIADCYFDSVPSLFIIGDVPSDECKGDRDIRAFGFQETDIVSVCKPITKYSVQVDDLTKLRYELEKAFFITQEGRKGPVLFSIPENLQYRTDFFPEEMITYFDSLEYKSSLNKNTPDQIRIEKQVSAASDLINKSKRPIVLVGGGIRLADAVSELRSFLKKTNIPMVYSLMGKDAISSEYAFNLGFIGNFGTRYANFAIANSDLLIVLGSRLDNMQTGQKIETFAREAKKIQVDIDGNELGIRVGMDILVHADLKNFLKRINDYKFRLDLNDWHKKVISCKHTYPTEKNLDQSNRPGNQLISYISSYLREDDCICVDVGEHQMLVAQSLRPKSAQRVLFSGSFGSMGFSLPAAIGATLATGKRSIVITGDGGFQMNIQELEIIKRRNLPIKIFVINNNELHMVKLRQDTYLEGNRIGTERDYSVPSFKKIGEAYGIKSQKVSQDENIKSILKLSLENNESEIIDIQIPGEFTTVEPRLDFNRSFEDMRPHLDREELAEQMVNI